MDMNVTDDDDLYTLLATSSLSLWIHTNSIMFDTTWYRYVAML